MEKTFWNRVNNKELLEQVGDGKEVIWINENQEKTADALAKINITMADIDDAEARLARFAPFIKKVFPETEPQNGLIESPLTEIPHMQKQLEEEYSTSIPGRLFLKQDSHLAISGSVKARGGIYEVLKHAEDLALEHGKIKLTDDYSVFACPEFKEFFSQFKIQVGSTGNLGMSIGIMSAALGFHVIVHMSADAKQWKKDLLRQRGAEVIEYNDDYSKAVEVGRKNSDADPSSYFVDDENSVTLFLGYAVAAKRIQKQFVEKVGNYTVLTTSINYASTRQLMLKRLMDIAGGLVGCIFTGIICIFVGPAIYIASPGPIFFAQERVGKNGKKFKMYKFRSMYMDAEERKAELMKDNKLGDGKMFKLDFDPRVIGNKILPDGTHKTGIGDFIRRTSLDEFPQFFNVLRGDMSIIGTRPPLISETNLYELHHRARLAIKPGITGMWQVSGRSDITDFEEVVRLDKEYITNWNIELDMKILLKTILVVFRKDGSM
mgnify:CR=1 FL=1